jgi:hypothetical protein
MCKERDTMHGAHRFVFSPGTGTMVGHLDVLGISHASTVPYPWTPKGAGWYDPRYSYILRAK